MPYNAEKRYFDTLRDSLSQETKEEYERAVATLVERYNTTIYENRFVVGGALELLTIALLRSVGIPATAYGDETAAGDILLPNNLMLSVKSRFTRAGNIRLINKQGGGYREWQVATLFVVSEVGMIYADPDMVEDDDIVDSTDAIQLKGRSLLRLAENQDNKIPMDIPLKPPKEQTLFSLKASDAVARQIITELNLANLQKSAPPG